MTGRLSSWTSSNEYYNPSLATSDTYTTAGLKELQNIISPTLPQYHPETIDSQALDSLLQFATLDRAWISAAYLSHSCCPEGYCLFSDAVVSTIKSSVAPCWLSFSTHCVAVTRGTCLITLKRSYRPAIHHVLPSTSRSQSATTPFLIVDSATARLTSPSSSTTSRPSPFFQTNLHLHPDLLLRRSRDKGLRWHL